MTPAALVAYRTLSDVAGKAAFFAVTILAARRLSRDGFGVFAVGTTAGWMAAVASDFGMQMHLARAVARSPGAAQDLLRTWLTVRIASASVAFVAVTIALLVLDATRFVPAVLLLVLGYLVAGLVEFLHYFFRGLSRSDLESTLTLWQRIGTLACAATALWLRPEITVLAAAMLAPVVVTAAFSVGIARRMAAGRASSPPTPSVAAPSVTVRFVASDFLRNVAPIGAGILLSALYFRIDIFLLQAWRGTEAVALYNAVFRIVEAMRLFPAAVLAVALPMLVGASSSRPIVQLSAGLTGFGVVVGIALWTSAGWLVPFVYGAGYVEAVPAFRILAASFPLMSLNYALTCQLIGWNRQREYAGLCLTALVFNVALNVRLIPRMSLTGAAWATLWTEAVLTLGCAIVLFAGTERDMARRGARAAGADSTEAADIAALERV
jgi:O-antigen/teichoic acid export membrane protein